MSIKPSNKIRTDTLVYAVIGNPVGHSLSPVMHNKAFSHVGHNGVYLAFRVEAIGTAVSGIKALGIRGVSVTIPHKVAVMRFLDRVDDMSQKIGAVNTLINENGLLTGCNTDCIGAVTALKEKTTIKDKEVIIVGAGGAARAIGFGIVSEGGRVTVLNRSKDKGKALARDLGGDFRPLVNPDKVNGQILINTTSVGMIPGINAMPVKRELLREDMVVMDIVYNPLKTRLLKEAEDMGCITIGGVSMFVHQGAIQFERWTGKKAPVDIMKRTVMDVLKKRESTCA